MANSKNFDIAFRLGAKIQSSLGSAFNVANKNMTNMNKKIKDSQRQSNIAQTSMNKLGGAIKGVAAAAAAYAGISAMKAFASESVELAKAQIEVETKLEAVLKNVKSVQKQGPEAYKKVKTELMGVASELQNVGVIGDEVTIAGMQQLATFQLGQKEIEKLSGGMLDLLAQQKGLNATQQDAVNIGNMIGKVMNGQVGALSRVGISFTKAQEKALKTGDATQRAAVLAEVLQQNVGGVNKALAQTDQGKIQQMNNSWGDMKEEVGKKILPIQAKFAGWFTKKIPTIQNLLTGMLDKVSLGFDFIGKIANKISPYIDGLVNAFEPIKKVVMPILLQSGKVIKDVWITRFNEAKNVVSNVINQLRELSPFFSDLGSRISKGFSSMLPMIQHLVSRIDGAIKNLIPIFTNVFSFIAKNVMPLVTNALSFLVDTVIPLAVNTISMWIPKIVTVFQNLWFLLQPIISGLVTTIQFAFPLIKDIIMIAIHTVIGIVSGLMDSLNGIILFVTGVFTGNWSKAWEGVREIFGGIFSSLVSLVKSPMNAVIAVVNQAIRGINSINIDIPDWVPKYGGQSFGLKIPEIPMLAKGGITTGPTLAMIGEGAEQEVVLPLSKLNNLLNGKGTNGNSGGDSEPTILYNPQINVQGNADEGVIQKAMGASFNEFKRFMARYESEKKRLRLN